MSQRVDKDSLPLDKPRRTPGHPTKSHIVKTKVDGKEKIIRFGEQGAETAGKPKAGESDRMKQKRASFKSRHAKNIAKGKSSPAYWANKVKWAEGGAVKMAAGGSPALALIEQMRRSGAQTPEFDAVLASTREQRSRPRPRPTPVAAQPREEELPLPPLPPARRPDENPPPGAPRNPMVFDEGNPHVATAIRMARQYGIPQEIFLSLVQQESGFNPRAVSPRGAQGLGQLMPGTARELGVTDPFNPEQNLDASARYLRQMLDRFGDMSLALAAYNAGPTTVRRAGNTIPNIRETQQYVPSILRRAGVSTGPEYARGGLAELDQKYTDAAKFASKGRNGDTLVAHITPREALMLKYMGGSGTINPRTGFLEFYDGGGDSGGGEGGGNEGGGTGDGPGGGPGSGPDSGPGTGPDSGPGTGPDSGPGPGTGTGPDAATAAAEAAAAAAAANVDADASPGGVNSGSTSAGGWGGGDWGGYSEPGVSPDSAIAAGYGPESPGYGSPNLNDPSNAIGAGYGPESPGYGAPSVYGGGYNNDSGNDSVYVPAPVAFVAPVAPAGFVPQAVAQSLSATPSGPSAFGVDTTRRNVSQSFANFNPYSSYSSLADLARAASTAQPVNFNPNVPGPNANDAGQYLTYGKMFYTPPYHFPQAISGFAKGGLAELDQKYAEGGSARAYDPDAIEQLAQSVTEPEGYAEGGRVGRVAGAISRAVRRAPAPEDPPMIALHNVSQKNLARIAESGDEIVAPSIGITRTDEPFEHYGDVTLVAPSSMVDPRTTPVYSTDAYTPRHPHVFSSDTGENYLVHYDRGTGKFTNLPYSPMNALRVMESSPWRGVELSELNDLPPNWVLARAARQFKNMRELQNSRGLLTSSKDAPGAENWNTRIQNLADEWNLHAPDAGDDYGDFMKEEYRDNPVSDILRHFGNAAENRGRGLNTINREYYEGYIPRELIDRTAETLRNARDIPTDYFEAKPRRLVPLSEFRGAIVPENASDEIMEILRRNNIENIARYANRGERYLQMPQFRDLFFTAAPLSAGVGAMQQEPGNYAEGGLAELGRKYAEGGEVMSDEEYDRRLLSRMKAQTGRTTEPTRAEQMQALRTAGTSAAEGLADVLLPQSPLDVALMVALGPGGRAARLAGAGALAALEPSEAEASRFRRLVRAYHGSPHKFDEFDIRKIGTGEGAQAYGRGLYFAENEDIARSYRDKLSPLGTQAARSDIGPEGLVARLFDEGLTPQQALEEIDFRRSLPHIREGLERGDQGTLEFVAKLDRARELALNPSARGHMYEVDLNADPREFLNWDAPLSRQSPEVRESLERFNIRVDPEGVEEYQRLLRAGNTYGPKPRLPEFSPDPTGQEIYQRVLRMDPEEARVALMQAGIPGTRYFDAGSRGVGGGTSNYAVFDPEIIDIQRRYAEGGAVNAEPAPYNAEAVDALVKQIEGEYV